ncbi:2-methylcitrate dehydratase [Agaricicola taiwanensis]|uniref:2-methylcitrate dehydratase n=1 Tax=Agaricicola taiwanensis TaxID=591372 RepID=A0A8J2YIS7_9RHOB|nr:MmgE/PrpD family protein [Agaricicola taiwanensis]GGE45695.1 2-methylcitrate dehydratase [Agaricicola taiwanensis]
MEILRELAGHVASISHATLDDETREAACRAVFDLTIAAAVGIDAPGPLAVRKAARVTMCGGALPVWFTGERLGLAGAVWCNTSASAALDLDDGHRMARGHPGAAVVPAAVAAAEETGATTEDLLRAIAVGYEVGVAVGAARRFYANTGMWSGYGVVAALGFLRRTPQERLAQAFAISGISAPNQLHAGAGPVFRAQEGSDVKEGIPWSSVTAVNALLLAEAGHDGPIGLLDSDEHFHLDGLVEGLGRQRYVTRSYIKFLTCCRHVHPPVDAVIGLIAAHRIDSSSIDGIEVETYSGALRLANRPEPRGFTDIQFSIPYCLALVALDGPEALLPLTQAAVGRPDVAALAGKVSLRLAPDLDARFPAETLSRVTIRAGRDVFISPITAPRGEASAPPSWSDLEEKLWKATRFTATPEQQERLIDAAARLRDGDHGPLITALSTLVLSEA